ncbi:hypothetical protein CbuD7D7780_02395 [Coxiella burnetii]|nr:hypothetical protein [Coxiella burnetii]OYK82882.1 hypothetical protein CbuD7D7780_02395 [Coxiella burnetii]
MNTSPTSTGSPSHFSEHFWPITILLGKAYEESKCWNNDYQRLEEKSTDLEKEKEKEKLTQQLTEEQGRSRTLSEKVTLLNQELKNLEQVINQKNQEISTLTHENSQFQRLEKENSTLTEKIIYLQKIVRLAMQFQEEPKTVACSNEAIAPPLAMPFSSPVSPLDGSLIPSEEKEDSSPKRTRVDHSSSSTFLGSFFKSAESSNKEEGYDHAPKRT